jgi:phage terminase large subunit-like protein
MSFKSTSASDYVVGQIWARSGSNFYLLEQIRERLDFAGTVAAFERMVSRWPKATAKYIEDKANGPRCATTYRESRESLR